MLLDLVDFGIDMFDSSYPYIITEQAGALIFPVNDSMQSSINNMEKTQAYSSEDHNSLNHILSHSDDQVFENPPTKKMKLITASKYHIFISDAR